MQDLYICLVEGGYSPREARRAIRRYRLTGDIELLWWDPAELA